MVWLINTDSAVHPPFFGKAKLKSADLRPVCEAICGGRMFGYSREARMRGIQLARMI
jgi:hypothetical protein